jgi:hypothetical protein
LTEFSGRVLPVDTAVAQRCARLHVPDKRGERDALIAAIALVHGMAVVTRNVADFKPIGVTSVGWGEVGIIGTFGSAWAGQSAGGASNIGSSGNKMISTLALSVGTFCPWQRNILIMTNKQFVNSKIINIAYFWYIISPFLFMLGIALSAILLAISIDSMNDITILNRALQDAPPDARVLVVRPDDASKFLDAMLPLFVRFTAGLCAIAAIVQIILRSRDKRFFVRLRYDENALGVFDPASGLKTSADCKGILKIVDQIKILDAERKENGA